MKWDMSQAEDALSNLFTPSMPATRNYVGRGNLDKFIFREFAQRGRQVLIFGPTGAGKTSMVLDNLNKLARLHQTDYIRVSMTNTTTIESFIGLVAAKLGLARQVQSVTTAETNHGLQAGLNKWISLGFSKQDKETQQEITEQYTGADDFAILEEVLFKRNTILVVDDMENLSTAAKNLKIRLAEIAKNMSDDAVNYEDSYAKIVFVGIASTAEELWNGVQSLQSRLATINVPYLTADESEKIIKNGWTGAKIASSDNQIETTAYISSGIGKIVHELGQKAGFAALDDETVALKDKHIKDTYIDDAIQEVFEVNQITFESLLTAAKNKNSTKTMVRNYVLYAMANEDNISMKTQDILKSVNELRHDSSMGTNSLSPALTQLKKLGVLISENRNSWQFADPMFKAYVREHRASLLKKGTQ